MRPGSPTSAATRSTCAASDVDAGSTGHGRDRLFDQAKPASKLLAKKYRDVPMDLADACLVDLADRVGTGRILTLDSDFEIYRWRSRRKFERLPGRR